MWVERSFHTKFKRKEIHIQKICIEKKTTMNLSEYTCLETMKDWKRVLAKKMGCSNTETVLYVKDENIFDISAYNGKFPIGLVKNGKTIIGWTNKNSVTNIYQLEPWASKPPPVYPWGLLNGRNVKIKTVTICIINRCDQLTRRPSVISESHAQFEMTRHVLFYVVLATGCIPVKRLLELELQWMESLISCKFYGSALLRLCCKHLPLDHSTKCSLRKFIEKQYLSVKLPDDYVPSEFILKQGQIVKGLIN